jgi:hypothetical protein
VKTYRNHKAIQARGGGGRFRRWDLDRDYGTRECPWCHTLSAHQPDVVADRHGFIDPVEFNRRVCRRCGWDSASKHSVTTADGYAAAERWSAALDELELAELDGADTETLDILRHQLRREERITWEYMWMKGEADGRT